MLHYVKLGEHRVTVGVDEVLSDLLTLKLGGTPDDADAHSRVRRWLQDRIDEATSNPERATCSLRIDASHLVSRWLRLRIVEALVSDELAQAYGRWSSEQPHRP
jgi:hypothetical protein